MKKTYFALLFLPLAAFVFAEPQTAEDIEVKVQIAGENVTVDLNMTVAATRQETWAVLTDFAHMPDFVSNVKESKVLSTEGDTLRIFQRGSATYGPVSFKFETTRELKLDPFDTIHSRLVSGTMRKMDGTTRLVEEGTKTRIIYHAESIPGTWVPPMIGKAFIAHETREQFREMRNEIIRRKQSTKPSVPHIAGRPIWQGAPFSFTFLKT